MQRTAAALVAVLLIVASASVWCGLQCELAQLGAAAAHHCDDTHDSGPVHWDPAFGGHLAKCKPASHCHLMLAAAVGVLATIAMACVRRSADRAPDERFTSLIHAPLERPPKALGLLPA